MNVTICRANNGLSRIENVIDYLEAADILDKFFDEVPLVTREQAVQMLELAKEALLIRIGAP